MTKYASGMGNFGYGGPLSWFLQVYPNPRPEETINLFRITGKHLAQKSVLVEYVL